MYRKTAGRRRGQNLWHSWSAAGLMSFSFSRKSASQCARRRNGGGIWPHLTRLRFAGKWHDPLRRTQRMASQFMTCSIPIAALTAIRAVSFA